MKKPTKPKKASQVSSKGQSRAHAIKSPWRGICGHRQATLEYTKLGASIGQILVGRI